MRSAFTLEVLPDEIGGEPTDLPTHWIRSGGDGVTLLRQQAMGDSLISKLVVAHHSSGMVVVL